MSRLRRAGFTLLEMMVALGILATSYVALMQAQSGSIRLSAYGKRITIATFLAQAKMEETDELLAREGFPDMDDEDEGNFEELGYPSFKWQLAVRKVELPLAEAFGQLLNQFGGGEDGQEGGTGGMGGGMGGLEGKLSGLMGGKGGKGGTTGMTGGMGGAGGISGMLNPEMLKGKLDMLANMLEQSLREVQLTVFWDGGGKGKELVLTTHLVAVPQAPGAPGATGQMPGQPGSNPVLDQLRGGKPGLNSTKPTGTRGSGRNPISPSLKR
jgi:general secretion pathway protein I